MEGDIKYYEQDEGFSCTHQYGLSEMYLHQGTLVELCNNCEVAFLSKVNLPSGRIEATDLVEILKATGWKWPLASSSQPTLEKEQGERT